MSSPKRHILFLATEYDAPGMRPYAANIINALWQDGDHVLVVTRYGADANAFPSIPDDAVTWVDYPTSKISKALFRFWPAGVLKAIRRLIPAHGIDLIYSLTGELVLAHHVKRLQRRVPMLYTVHDAIYHDYKFSNPLRWLKDRLIIAWPQQRLFNLTPHKVTNSHEQLRYIRERWPQHESHYAPFPSLVNQEIASGQDTVPELSDVASGYILFFGTLHLYKGVHLLYDAYLSHPELRNRPLVIAGTQDIYFPRRDDENGVTFINRFIQDSEVRDLFTRAAVVIYPYISATQSGVTSIASYFDRPMVLSDLPFFKQSCEGCEGIEFFATGDREALADAIRRSLQSPGSTRSLYDSHYTTAALQTALYDIMNDVIKQQQKTNV